MSETSEAGEAAPGKGKKGGKTGGKGSRILLIALPLALLLGGGAFYGVYSGLVPLPFGLGASAEADAAAADAPEAAPLEAEAGPEPTTAFVALEPLLITLGPEAGAKHLKLSVQLEVARDRRDAVAERLPRVADVLNTFLRAVDVSDVGRPRSMLRLRAQMLRRVQLVIGPGAVHDLLIQEFVLN